MKPEELPPPGYDNTDKAQELRLPRGWKLRSRREMEISDIITDAIKDYPNVKEVIVRMKYGTEVHSRPRRKTT